MNQIITCSLSGVPVKYIICSLLLILSLYGCGKNTNLPPVTTPTQNTVFGADSTLDVVTWNIENFPKDPNHTADYLVSLITPLKVDLIAVQEIQDASKLASVAQRLGTWNSIVINNGYQSLGYLYNTRNITVLESYAIYTDEYNAFPRRPFVVKIDWRGQIVYVINNHLKAMGDNVIDYNNPDDEEMRRIEACRLLDQYIETNLPNEKVIVVGDWNDKIEEPNSTNVFTTFLSKPAEYAFADMAIAETHQPDYYSYPSYNSNLDHILLSNELFPAFNNSHSQVKVLTLDKNLAGGFHEYDTYVSDHRPVAIKLPLLEAK